MKNFKTLSGLPIVALLFLILTACLRLPVEVYNPRGDDGQAQPIATVAELYEGIYGSTDPQATEQTVQQFLKGVPILSIDQTVARRFGQERMRLRAAGQLIGDVDLFIGATALTNGLTLLTNNRRHFERLEGLTIESL